MNISQIIPAPWNTRTAITDESVRSLAASMEADGLIQPISVCDSPDGEGYICYDGNRRLAAAKLLGWTEIAANWTEITPDEAKVRTVTANLQRDDDDPLLAAGVISTLLDDGLDAGRIAAKLGKTAAWVNRRRKLVGAADALKAVANKVTVEALERVAVLPEKVQAAVCETIERKAQYMGRIGLAEIKYDIEREMRDLDGVKFDTAECAACPKRTGAEQDLFGECEDGLGKCMDCKCFEKHRKAWEDAEIARLVGDAEVVRVEHSWQMPSGADAGEKRTKKHPCAYVRTYSDHIEVVWGESAKAKKAREQAEAEKANAEKAERAEERMRLDAVSDALREFCAIHDGEIPAKVVRIVTKRLAKNTPQPTVEYIVDKIANDLDSWKSNDDWGAAMRAFPELADAAGVAPEEAEHFLASVEGDGDEG